MAALLKKRALAEYSHVIQEEVKPAPKRLRLAHKPKSKTLNLDLRESLMGPDALQALVQLESSMFLQQDCAVAVTSVILEQSVRHEDPLIRSKLLMLVGEISKSPNCNMFAITDTLLRVLQTEKSNDVLSSAVASVLKIFECFSNPPANVKELIEPTLNLLRESNHHVKRRCIQLIGAIGAADMKFESWAGSTLTDILVSFMNDDDCRVRSSAFEAMVQWHQRGVSIGQSIYGIACNALLDDYEEVRMSAVKLIWVFCQLNPEVMLTTDRSQESVRLVDDGFAKICNAVNDYSVKVRVTAMGLLGSLHNVSGGYLQQTLDKKLMSNLRRKIGAHQRQKTLFQSGEWSTGQKWADDAPKEEMDEVEVTLMSSGACGAFIHGLEDEFFEVRNAAVDSLCELASGSPSFARLSQDYIVDMFNDEIQSVRLNAINSLKKITQHIVLREDQLDIIVSCLKDYSAEIRESLRDMLSHAALSTRNCIDTAVLCLIDNMKRYPEDQMSIWECLRHVGTRHPELTLASFPDLMSAHPYFESQEPDIHDPAYVGVLILIFNAASKNVTVLSLLPDYAMMHYKFVRDTIPNYIPQLCADSDIKLDETASDDIDISSSTLKSVLSSLQRISSLTPKASMCLMKASIQDMTKIANTSASANALCHQQYLTCQSMLGKLLEDYRIGQLNNEKISSGPARIKKLVSLTLQLEYCFKGLSFANLAAIHQLRLRAHTLHLLSLLQSNRKVNRSFCVKYLQILNQLQRMLSQRGTDADAFTEYLLSQMGVLESCEPKMYQKIAHSALALHTPSILNLKNVIHQTRATLTASSALSEHTIKFTSGLIAPVHVVANINNLEEESSVFIMIKYPDQQVHYVRPNPDDLRRQSCLSHKLATEVMLSHSVWSESAPVQISLVLAIHTKEDAITDIRNNNVHYVNMTDSPINVTVQPTPVKK